MKRSITCTAVALTVLAAATTFVIAANPHFKDGPTFSQPTVTTVKACATVVGVGNQDLTITITAQGVRTVTCTNPGGHKPPGQNRDNITTVGSTSVPASEVKNGNVSFCVQTQEPSDEGKSCPGPFTRTVEVDFTSATLTIEQGGQVVLEESFSL